MEVAATEGATEVATEVGALEVASMAVGVRLELLDVARDAPGGAIS